MSQRSTSLRSERARRRAAKLRNQRIGLAVLGILALAGIGYLAWSAFGSGSKTNANTNTTSSGLQIQDEVVGTGAEATPGQQVTVNYTGWLMDGTKFDSSLDRNQPFSFVLGGGQVIKGWDEGVAGMKVGGKRILIIPPELGYGAQGAGGVIPANATLKFEVELLNVSGPGQPPATTQP